ncbi:transposase [Collinsella bouchesdurhonensis]|uniref:transposase n=2 Tax=Collinsella bouchesdurhonensis TaxID=1907654 RepID=UPI003F8CE571
MRDPGHPRHFTDEFKRQIVDLYNAGKPKREIMDEYDLGKSTVERWIKSINATGSSRAADSRTESTPIPLTPSTPPSGGLRRPANWPLRTPRGSDRPAPCASWHGCI